ncbi:MAG: antitoxin YefM [Desulfovibrionales bacterium]|jgi:PHD/YefM family antitoxin component YafN of YafNO toxin-antitoxin module|nr:antitoxin YefM [Desulfovibrionales bacterium]
MEKSMNITEVRSKLTSLSDDLAMNKDTLAITKRGKPVLALMPWDIYEALVETMDVMSDPDLMQAFREGVRDIQKGRTRSLADVKSELGL